MQAFKYVKKTTAGGEVVSGSPDAGVALLLDTTGDILVADVSNLINVTVQVNQVNDAGTAAILIEGTIDGLAWFTLTGGSLTDASFPAGNNTALALGLSDARGMSLAITAVRARATAIAGGGTYRLAVGGLQVDIAR